MTWGHVPIINAFVYEERIIMRSSEYAYGGGFYEDRTFEKKDVFTKTDRMVRVDLPLRIYQLEQAMAKVIVKTEVGALAIMDVEGISNDEIVVKVRDFHIPKQQCHAGHQEPTGKALDAWLEKYAPQTFTDTQKRPCTYRWHTHVPGVGAFFSPEDMRGMEHSRDRGGFVVSVVQNHEGMRRVRCDVNLPLTKAGLELPCYINLIDHDKPATEAEMRAAVSTAFANIIPVRIPPVRYTPSFNERFEERALSVSIDDVIKNHGRVVVVDKRFHADNRVALLQDWENDDGFDVNGFEKIDCDSFPHDG